MPQLVGLSAGFVGVDRDPDGAAAQAGFERMGFGEGVAEPDLERGRPFAEFGDPGREPGGAGAEPAEPFFEFAAFGGERFGAFGEFAAALRELFAAFLQFPEAFGEFADAFRVGFDFLDRGDEPEADFARFFGVFDQADLELVEAGEDL